MNLDREISSQRNLLTFLLCLTGISCAILGGYSIIDSGRYLSATVEILMALTCLLLLIATLRLDGRWLFTLSVTYLVLFYGVLLFRAWNHDVSQANFAWTAVAPFLAYILLGRLLGVWAIMLLLVGMILAFIDRALAGAGMFDLDVVVSFATPALVSLVICHLYATNVERSHEELERMATTDPLTGLYNRAQLRPLYERMRRKGKNRADVVSAILFDLDHFKKLNDTYGHDAGDAVLVHVAKQVQARLRGEDVFARIGGEEFVVLLPRASVAGAMRVAEDLRKMLEQSVIEHNNHRLTVTMTAGVAQTGKGLSTLKALLKEADRRLYYGKATGRNRVYGKPVPRKV